MQNYLLNLTLPLLTKSWMKGTMYQGSFILVAQLDIYVATMTNTSTVCVREMEK